jgi:acetyl-CoA acetyltransferase
MAAQRSQVAVIGVGYSKISRRSELTLGQLGVTACMRALDDAGLVPADIDGICNYPAPSRPMTHPPVDGIDIVSVNYVSQALDLRNLCWACSISGGTITASITEAVNALASGACTFALVWRGMHNPGGGFGRIARPSVAGAAQFTVPFGLGHNVIGYALPYSRYMAKYGATREHLAPFMVRNRALAAQNPDAVFCGQPITYADYMGSRMIAEPLSLLDCDMPVDGCGALVLTTADRACDFKQSPAYIVASVSLGLPLRSELVMTLEGFMESGARLARALWSKSGLSAGDVTHAHLYDGFSYFIYLWLEIFGFFPEGQSFAGLQHATDTLHGRLDLNTSGGALGMGRLHGTPQLIEAVLQIQRRSGCRQVADPSLALVQTGDPLHACGALLLSDRRIS